ncbi:hypothetical protein [Nocardioides acrostichi]|uniref:Uncharacterized protein n=1 Tax=Nocardioides acrostichi TaxID=2784339 RepID=A0A930UYT1_9ACTN|nr:hypothetical protein [Nocardioides acrostichi]MBF4163378.1 hypothetical protein [Nocardioides acrostichi]
MSEQESEHTDEKRHGISDEQLPEDLVPGDDNPLAEGLPAGEGAELLEDGKVADEMDDADERDDESSED